MYWFCQISKWIRHRYTCVPHPEPSSLLKHKLYHSPAQNPTHFFLWPDKLSPLLCSPYSTHVGLSIAAQIRHQSHVFTIRLSRRCCETEFPVGSRSSDLVWVLKTSRWGIVILSRFSPPHNISWSGSYRNHLTHLSPISFLSGGSFPLSIYI